MANIKKNFNFRNGVQVDDDNLLVTSTGLVGIGTTVPVEALDVRGNVVITGFTSTTTAQIGVLTVTTFVPNKIVGAGLSVASGIVTATGTGILTYFGDASNLLGMPTSQWEDKDVGLGFTSIYNTGGNVGVGTEDPRSTFQVGNNADAGEKGVGISSVGNINATGIVTAVSFVGDLTGNIVSGSTFSGDIDLNADLDVDGHTNLDNVNISGVTTTTGNVDIDADLDVDGHTNLDNIIISGVTTTTGNVDIDADLDVDGHTNLDNLSVAGVSTFSSLIDANGGATIDSIKIGIDTNEEIGTTTGNLTLDSAAGQVIVDDHLSVVGVSTFSQDVAVAGITTTKNLLVTGVTTFSGAVNATSIDVPTATVTSRLGVGSTETPVSDIQIIKQDFGADADLQVSALNGISAVKVGREIGTAKTHTSEIRFGGGAGAPYSNSGTALDIINYDTGNFNYHLSGDNASAVVGDFHWHKGINSARLMTLTGIGGSLGIGNTQPTKELDVTGAGNFTGDVTVGNNLTVGGSFIGSLVGTLTGNVTGTLEGNSNVTVGISTLNNLTIAGIMTASQANITAIGIGTNPDTERPFRINDAVNERIFVSSTGSVGIQTTVVLPGVGINASQTVLSVGAIGVGVTIVHKAVDLSNAGLSTNRMMVLPKVNGTGGLQDPVSGAIVYNTATNRVMFYNGSSWGNI